MSVIIMEGPDGCGKTNIGKALAEELGYYYFKVDSEKHNWRAGKFKEALEFDQTYIAQFLTQVPVDVVIDRAFPSEFVYSAVFKRETNPMVLKKVDEMFGDMDAVVIILLRHDYSGVKDDLVPTSDLQKIHHLYWAFYAETNCRCIVMHVDEFNNDLKLQLPRIVDALHTMDTYPDLDRIILKPEKS